MITALHELIGHGSGKLLTKNIENGETNYPIDLVNPITGEPIKNPYGTNETFNQRFKKLASAFEESRAEAVAFYFLFMNDTWPLFCKPYILLICIYNRPR
jgi:dipeptidyl-peptidase III